jgi:predicted aspartyl protease
LKTLAKLNYEVAPVSEAHMIVPVKINGEGPFNFILDTGASAVCLSKELTKKLKIRGGSKQEALSASGVFEIKAVKIRSISVQRAQRRNLEVAVMDLSYISEKLETKVEGILGYDYLKSFQLSINYPQQQITLKK